MMLISAPWPNASNERNGMVRRVAAIDKALDHVDRVYLNFRSGPRGTWPVATVQSVAPGVRLVELNAFEPADFETLMTLADESACLLAHSVYWARHVLPLYRERPTITDMHGVVPEEVLMMGGTVAEAELHASVEAFVLRAGVQALTVTDAMAAHLRSKHDVVAQLLTLPVEGGPPPADVLDKPRALSVVYCGGTEVWQQLGLMAQAIAAFPEQTVELRSPDVQGLERVLIAAGVALPVRSESPTQIAALYARSHFGFVLREDHLVNAVASPTKLQEYLSHGVVPIVLSPRIGDFEARGYRFVTVDEYRRKQLPDFETWREMAAHNLGVAREQAAASETGKRALQERVEHAHRQRHASVRSALLAERLRLGDVDALLTAEVSRQVANEREAERSRRRELERSHAIAVDALRQREEQLKHEARSAGDSTRRALEATAAVRQHAEWMEHTLSWKLTDPLRRGNQARRRAQAELTRRLHPEPLRPVAQTGHTAALEAILQANPHAPIVFTRPMLDWDWPMQQRPHHLATALGREGFLSFFVTPNARDRVHGFHQLGERCFLTDQFDLLLAAPRPRFLHVYSTDAGCDLASIDAARKAGVEIFYDVIDELHEDIAGRPISEAVAERHRVLMRDAAACTASAHRLLEVVRAARTSPFALVGNGVDVGHFSAPRPSVPPPPLAPVLARGAPIVGYFGALAKWFDYALVRRLALERPGLQVVLIGLDYDGSLGASGLRELPNVTVYGPVPWAELPQHASFFDVATVPFVSNAVTESTSPIKLFEFLAMGKPVVTTDLRECRQSRVARVARDANEFLAFVDAALARRSDPSEAERARAEAAEHTWQAKANVIAELLRSTLRLRAGGR